jgi:hypothetical protein
MLLVGDGAAAEADGGLVSAAKSCLVKGNSFTAGTLVLLADGHQKPISKIKAGDKVIATDPETGETAAKRVDKVIVHGGSHIMVDLTLADGSKISATDRHPFWDASTGGFTYAVDLRAGEKVREADGDLITITKTRSYTADLTAYNLTIDDIHTYYAGATPVLVHNSCTNEFDGLRRQITSQSQMAEKGRPFAGPGSGTVFRDADRVAAEYGGVADDYAKMASSSYRDGPGLYDLFATHWVQNVKTLERFEFKTKFPRAEAYFQRLADGAQ